LAYTESARCYLIAKTITLANPKNKTITIANTKNKMNEKKKGGPHCGRFIGGGLSFPLITLHLRGIVVSGLLRFC
jgi:hypothetical protein